MSKQQTSYPLRLNPILKSKVKILAKENSRSINGQLEFMVKKYLQDYEQEHGEIDITALED